jgi:lipoate-protein ligase A
MFIYTNGTLINDSDISMLLQYENIKCLNVGVHTLKQLEEVNRNLERKLPVRFIARDIYCNELMKTYPDRLNKENLKSWSLDQCNMSNEEWVLLTDFE